MSATVHTALYDAAVAALSRAPALADGNVRSMRQSNRRMADATARQVRVFLEQTAPRAVVGGSAPVDWTTTLRIECVARDMPAALPAVSAFDAASQLAASAQQRLLEDAAFNALAIEVTPGPMAWDEDEAETGLVACQIRVRVVHRSAYSNFSA